MLPSAHIMWEMGLHSSAWRASAHLVVAREPVDAALDENQAELAVLVLAIELQVLAHGHRLLDQVVKVLRDLWCQAQALEDAQNLGACHSAHLQPSTQRIEQLFHLMKFIKPMCCICIRPPNSTALGWPLAAHSILGGADVRCLHTRR